MNAFPLKDRLLILVDEHTSKETHNWGYELEHRLINLSLGQEIPNYGEHSEVVFTKSNDNSSARHQLS